MREIGYFFTKTKFLFIVILITVSVDDVRGIDTKYEILLSDGRYIFTSIEYKSEALYSDIFYKNKFLTFGASFYGVFNVPIYGFSGYIEDVVYLGNFGFYFGGVNTEIFNSKVGVLGRLDYRYILDYKEVDFSVSIYSRGRMLDNVSYFMVLESLGIGFYFTKFVPFRVVFVPIEYDLGVDVRIKEFKVSGSFLGGIDINDFWITPAFRLRLLYVVYDGVEVGVGNTFRVGNILNLDMISKLKTKNIILEGVFGFGYVNGFSGKITFSIQI